MPATKPHLTLDKDGVCDACRMFRARSEIDWSQRKEELLEILDRYRSTDETRWDCIVPVSGGKDSHYQVIRMKELGMNPLCVTATTCSLSDIGRKNIENLKSLGVDYIEFTTNREVRAKLNRIGLRQIGDISWPEHISINTVPVRAAVQFGVPLIVWGENSQNEYGGPASARESNVLTWEWLLQFAGFIGLRTSDVIGQEGITKKDMISYSYPSNDELARVGVTGIFLGYYIPWDGYANAVIAEGHGFSTLDTMVEGSLADYENLDNYQTGIHDYFKFLKFAYGRATDIACSHIRRNRLTRQDGLELTKCHDGKFPWTYLKRPAEEILSDIGIGMDEFMRICDQFTNKKLFLTDSKGNIVKDEHGNLTKINYDNFDPKNYRP